MEKEIGKIVKTAAVETRVRLTEFKGRQLIDIRDFFKAKNAIAPGPTKKGICLDISKISDIIRFLEIAEQDFLTSTKGTTTV